ncbi:MAG: phenol hydroxylase [Gammaproteobacteria bacterium]|nr:phenol hydroxylase [Gammaproteobacteria bacterium]
MSDQNRDYTQATRYVRVTHVRPDRLVEFEFSIDDPTLYVELVLPYPQFRLFCQKNKTRELTHEEAARVDLDKLKWREGPRA